MKSISDGIGVPRHVVFGLDRRRQRIEGVNHGVRISGRRPAGLRERAPAAAAQVDAESFEYRRGAEIAGHNFADRCRSQFLDQHSPRFTDPE